jgi:hypothetical protein
MIISRQVLPALQLGVSVGICQRPMVDESGMTRTQMGKHNRSENGRQCMECFVGYHSVTVT